MNKYSGNSENYKSLLLLAESEMGIFVSSESQTSYVKNNELYTESFNQVVIEEDFKDFRCGLKKLIQEAYTVHRSVNRVRNGVCLLSNPILRKQITPINKKQKQSKLFYKQSHFYHISKLKFMK